MQTFGTKDLDSMMEGLRTEHYSWFSTVPVVEVIYRDLLKKLENESYLVEIIGTEVFSKGHSLRLKQSVNVLDPNNDVLKIEFTYYYDNANDGLPDIGIVLTSEDPVSELFLSDHVSDIIKGYDAHTIWNEALKRGFCEETAYMYEERMTEYEMDRNYRCVQVFRASCGDYYRAVWTFDNEEFLWGSSHRKSTIPVTPDCTMCLIIGKNHSESIEGREEVFLAQSGRPILDRDCMGMFSSSGSAVDKKYYADKSREEALLGIVDSMVESLSMEVLYDARKK